MKERVIFIIVSLIILIFVGWKLGKYENKTPQREEYYMAEGHVGKVEYPFRESVVEYAVSLFRQIYESYLEDQTGKVYFSVVPDKNYYLAEKNGHPVMDYKAMLEYVQTNLPCMEHIDIISLLSAEDYYYTDTHWRQERLPKVAAYLAEAMGVTLSAEYEKRILEHPFYGVYYAFAKTPIEPDKIYYLTNALLENCLITDKDGEALPLYDMEKAKQQNAYEMFLAGNQPIITITNLQTKSTRELIIFRDSFGSSIAPLLVEQYQTITLIDVRFVRSYKLEEYVDFHGQDVLFLYSTLLLNNSLAMR